MATNADVLVNFQGIDNVSPIAQQIGASVNSMNGQAGGLMNTVSRLSSVFTGLNGLVMGVFGTMGLSSFKEMTYGTATAREQIKQLYETVAGSTEDVNSEAYKLWDTMDTLTNHGYVSLDQLGQAVNVLGLSTGATVEQMGTLTPVINEIGNRAILMGYDANRTQQLMNNVAQGLNGNTRMLNVAFGITADKLKAHGWSGKAEDIETYTKALKSYLNIGDDVGNHLDNTQGKVISLQKRFRIAGRNLGNYMLPPLNAIMDGFTKLNDQSNDLLASLIIIGTGAMSAFASIIPTINPLLQLHGILKDFRNPKDIELCPPFQQANKCIDGTNTLLNRTPSRFTILRSHIGRTATSFKNLIIIPVANFFKQIILNSTAWIRTPILSFLSNLTKRVKFAYNENIRFNKSLILLRNTSKSRLIDPLINGFSKLKGLVSNTTLKTAGFAFDYGSMGSQQEILNRLTKQWESKGVDPEDIINKKNKISMASLMGLSADSLIEETDDLKILNNLTKENEKSLGKLFGNNKLTNRMSGFTKAIKNSTVAMKLSTVANKLGVGSLIATEGATAGAEAGFLGMATAEGLALWPILLIIGAVVALILVIDQIGKTLGWWDDWKTMLDAIVNGLKRLWSAFINNPNVQGTIKMFQDAFGGLGSIINDVAWAVLEFFGWEDDGSEVDIVRMIIDAFGTLGRVMGDVVNVAKTVFSALWSIIGPIAGFIWGALRSIVCILIGCSPGIVPALQSVWDTFRSVFGGLASFITTPLQIIQTSIGTFLQILSLLGSTVMSVFGILGDLFSGKITFGQAIQQLIGLARTNLTQLGTIFRNHFNRIITIVINSAKRLVGGFINNILGFPRRVIQILMGLINNIINLPQQMANGAMEMAGGLEEGFMNGVRDWIPGAELVLGPKTNNYGKGTAKTLGNVNKSYTNTSKRQQGHTFNIGEGAIQLDARNLTTKESKQVMINALEGLTTYETIHTKNAKNSTG